MKSNRLNNQEIVKLIEQVERLRDLASMDNFSVADKEKTKMLKENMKPYMEWFKDIANNIEEVLKERDK